MPTRCAAACSRVPNTRSIDHADSREDRRRSSCARRTRHRARRSGADDGQSARRPPHAGRKRAAKRATSPSSASSSIRCSSVPTRTSRRTRAPCRTTPHCSNAAAPTFCSRRAEQRDVSARPRAATRTVSVPRLANILCGAHRPGHFDGVATVVLKLFNIVAPRESSSAKRTYQQLTLIRTFCAELDLPIEITGVPTCVRPTDWHYRAAIDTSAPTNERGAVDPPHADRVTSATRGRQPRVSTRSNERDVASLSEAGFDVDYVSMRDARTLEPATKRNPRTRRTGRGTARPHPVDRQPARAGMI